MTKNLDWKTGHNLNAFNDLLRGGFGVHEYEEPLKIIWKDFSESKKRLGEELIEKLLEIIAEHEYIEFETESGNARTANSRLSQWLVSIFRSRKI